MCPIKRTHNVYNLWITLYNVYNFVETIKNAQCNLSNFIYYFRIHKTALHATIKVPEGIRAAYAVHIYNGGKYMKRRVQLGNRYFCENNGVYLEVTGVGADSNVWYCVESEVYNDEFEAIGSGLYTTGELLSARWKEVNP